MTQRILELMRALGARIVNTWIWRLGFACRFLWLTLKESGPSFRRFHLTIREIYFSGVLSLVIILVSGLFVGMVLGLQGYDTLVRYGSSEALGVLVSLSLVRELGPVVAGLLFASRAGSAITAEIGLMKATEQLSAMEMMCLRPCFQEWGYSAATSWACASSASTKARSGRKCRRPWIFARTS